MRKITRQTISIAALLKYGNSRTLRSWPRNNVFLNNFLNSMSDHHEITTQFFLDPEVILSSHTMLTYASKKEFTLTHLVTFSISRTRIRMKFPFVYCLIRLWTKCL